ncbi:hypothetical protein ACFY64_31965 [Streptomyces collinus]|uniref:hypothetical protein n=1 Tax=Streptomyces collinus TaxID=42684 RepID=UPI0036B85723
MADPAFLNGQASAAAAAPIVDLIAEAGVVATGHFDQLPPGEEASVYVTLTADTGFGSIPLGMWNFLRSADGTVSLAGALEEGTDG